MVIRHLVDVGILLEVGEVVESGVQFVQHLDDPHHAVRVGVFGAIRGETDDSGEEQSYAVVPLRGDRPFVPELVRHADRQHGVQQSGSKLELNR